MRNRLTCTLLTVTVTVSAAWGAEKLDATLNRVETRLDQARRMDQMDPNSPAFLRALGQGLAPQIEPRTTPAPKTLTLVQCLQEAFVGSNAIVQVREGMLAVGGSKLIASSRFLPSVEMISQYERIDDLDVATGSQDSASFGATLRQRLLEYGKDNPVDVALRREQREALFDYENVVAQVFSQVRRAFYFVLLKQQQIATRGEQLQEFQKQYKRKQQRLDAGNLSVKFEVLTARLNVLTEQKRINSLQREQFNGKMELLRLIGLPVGADAVRFAGLPDSFGLNGFDMEAMVALSLSQSSQVALAEVLMSEQQRVLDQLKYEYLPDVRMVAGYQDRNGRVGIDLGNENDTWGLDLYGQGGQTENRGHVDGIGLFGPENTLSGPGRGSFAGVQMRVPVFEGRARQGRRIQNRAYLQRLKAALADTKDLIELRVRQNYRLLAEQRFQVDSAQQEVEIERERFSIYEQLRDVGRIDDDALERFRGNFFRAQDFLLVRQEDLIDRQENLRAAIRLFK